MDMQQMIQQLLANQENAEANEKANKEEILAAEMNATQERTNDPQFVHSGLSLRRPSNMKRKVSCRMSNKRRRTSAGN
jgi:crotonobetainyl-CoA:carnitine CoA-transferase CaiB-like acyl-CoA transferase